jgi:hypothetical protein
MGPSYSGGHLVLIHLVIHVSCHVMSCHVILASSSLPFTDISLLNFLFRFIEKSANLTIKIKKDLEYKATVSITCLRDSFVTRIIY